MLSRSSALSCVLLSFLGAACSDLVSLDRDGAAQDDEPETDAELDALDAAAGDPEGDDAAPAEPARLDASGADVGELAQDTGPNPDASSDAGVMRPSLVPGKSFETALRIEPGARPGPVDERSVDQVDYYVFHAEAGSFYELATDRSQFSPDNVIALYDAQKRLPESPALTE